MIIYLSIISYVLDGNALAQTATEAFRKRNPVDFDQQDTIVVSIGYPTLIPNSPYSDGRYYDYQMPVCANCTTPTLPGVPSGADAFITFIDDSLRPWIQKTVFPNVVFDRDGLYGHSFAGLFTIYAMLVRPDLFDVFLSASPYLIWNDDYIFSQLESLKPASPSNKTTKPAFQLSYGELEQNPQKRRRETQAEFEARRDFLSALKMEDLVTRLYTALENSTSLRHTELHQYPFSYHAAVGGNALADGIDYFLDW
jgi:predicted alpha/beta superfamily hydrolase